MRERKRCPRHPGYILKTLYIEPLALTITQLAQNLGVSRKTVSAIVNERKSVTPEMALRLAQAFPNSTPESWINLQRNYDLWQVAHRTSEWRAIHPMIDVTDQPNQAVMV
jgi:addiction module HigA family antidote